MARKKQIGFGIEAPAKGCDDKNCPFHGNLKIHGNNFTGKVVSDKMQRSVTVEWQGWKYIPKYERYTRTKTKIIAHNPQCINAVEGDMVRIDECRPLSKMKTFVVTKVLGKNETHAFEKEAKEEGKFKAKHAETKKPVEAADSAEEPENKETE